MGGGVPIRLALAVTLALYAYIFQQVAASVTIAALLLLSALPLRVEIDRIGEIIVALACLGGTYVLTVVIGPRPKHPISEAFAVVQAFVAVWCLLVCVARLFFKEPWGRQRGTALIAMLGVFACGGNRIGWIYHGAVAVFACFGLWALAADDSTRPGLGRATGRRRLLLGSGVVGAGAVAVALALALPILYQSITKRLDFSFLQRHQSGFDMYFRLGSLRDMIQSRRIVLRVHGTFRHALYLRGAVYNRYLRKHWRVPFKVVPRLLRVPKDAGPSPERMRVEYVGGNRERYFVPLRSAHYISPSGFVRIDKLGLLRPMADQDPDFLGFRLQPRQRAEILPPRDHDRRIPRKLRAILTKLAVSWTQDKATPQAKLQALKQRLREMYRYSLSFSRPKGREPLLDFLFHNRQGHCEYFASALALLARAVGIPTRVIGGYLVSEYNPYGGYYIVREQNAHAWVEAWLPRRGWVTADATPASGVAAHMPQQTSTFAGITDMVRMWLSRFQAWVATITFAQLFGLIGFFVALWIAIRLARRFRRRSSPSEEEGPRYGEPAPSFLDFLHALHPLLPRRESEPLERYADRLRDTSLPPAAHQASPIVLAYASYRYGKRGSLAALEQDMGAWMEAWQVSD